MKNGMKKNGSFLISKSFCSEKTEFLLIKVNINKPAKNIENDNSTFHGCPDEVAEFGIIWNKGKSKTAIQIKIRQQRKFNEKSFEDFNEERLNIYVGLKKLK